MAGKPPTAGRASGAGRHLRVRGRAEKGPCCASCPLWPSFQALLAHTTTELLLTSAIRPSLILRRLGLESFYAPALAVDSRDPVG